MKQVFNPYLPGWEYIPDGELRVFGNRLYVYGSHDQFDGKDFCLNDYVCWSAPLSDLSDWKYEGVIYYKEQDPRNSDGKMHMNAPDCVQGPNGRYYLYYQLHLLTCTSVAVADNPAGPFTFYGYVMHDDGTPWGEKKGDVFAFDPGVLVDDDGKTYVYVGFSPEGMLKKVMELRGNKVDHAVCLEMEEDMKTVHAAYPVVPGPYAAKGTTYAGHGFYEASSIRKVHGKYYFVYSSVLSHELCYAVGDSPLGPFRYGGTLVSIADLGYKGNRVPTNYTGNTHGGMVEINGQWYIFYHRQTNRTKCSRQGCAEKIYFNPDGSIPQVEVTSCGLNDGPLAGKGFYEARIACNLGGEHEMVKSDFAKKLDKKQILPYFTQGGKDREGSGESVDDQYVANLTNGAWCGFKYFAFDGTESRVKVTLRPHASEKSAGTLHTHTSTKSAGTLRFFTDRWATQVAMIPVEFTDGAATIKTEDGSATAAKKAGAAGGWTDFSAVFAAPTGTQALYVKYEGQGSVDFLSFEVE